jgi:hypothetical protein
MSTLRSFNPELYDELVVPSFASSVSVKHSATVADCMDDYEMWIAILLHRDLRCWSL